MSDRSRSRNRKAIRKPRPRGLERTEWGAAILLTLLAILFHAAFLTHAGALWRDEVNSVEFATMPSLSHIFASLQYDGFPPLSTLLLREWAIAGWGRSDLGFRIFGFAIGVALLGALWLTCRLLRGPAPLISLALLGLNPWVVRTVDSVRPYGLGIVLIVVTLGLLWKAIQDPSPRRMIAAGVLAILSVQCMYQNAFLLFGICLAGIVVPLRSSSVKTAGAVAGVGAAAAFSLLVDWPSIAGARSWNVVVQTPTEVNQLLSALIQALGPSGPAAALTWLFLALACCGVGVRALRSRAAPEGPDAGPDPALFGAVVIVAVTAAFLVALKATRLMAQPWYYVPLMGVVAPVLDATLSAAAQGKAWRLARLLAVIAIVATTVLPGWRQVVERRTNVDAVAALLGKESADGDAIVVHPWYYGVSFQRYYKGPARWVTLPPLEEIRIHRYDLLKAAMGRTNPIDSVLVIMGEALKSGHRLWLVGGLPDPRSMEQPRALPPAPNSTWGWSCAPYLVTWSQQAAYYLKLHALNARVIPLGTGGPINPYENIPVIAVSGWR